MTAAPAGQSPLSGITVLALEQAIAAPLCTRHLADLGGRVPALGEDTDAIRAEVSDQG